MALTFSAVEGALVAWLEATFGAGKVMLSGEKGPAPAMPYAKVSVSGPRRVGAPHGAVLRSYDGGQPLGQELEERVMTEEELAASIQAYTAARSGDASAKALLKAARLRLSLPSVRAVLAGAGLSVLEVGDTQDVSALLGTSFSGRASLDLRLLASDEVAERTGYVATVGLTKTLT